MNWYNPDTERYEERIYVEGGDWSRYRDFGPGRCEIILLQPVDELTLHEPEQKFRRTERIFMDDGVPLVVFEFVEAK